MSNNRTSGHSTHNLQVHIVWCTKYRYHVLKEEVQLRCRDLMKQICNGLDVQILKGVVSKDHIHLHISYPPKISISDIIKRLKGRSSRKLLQEYPHLKKRYWGGHFWAIGYGCWSVGNITDEMLQVYLSHHKDQPNDDENFILE